MKMNKYDWKIILKKKDEKPQPNKHKAFSFGPLLEYVCSVSIAKSKKATKLGRFFHWDCKIKWPVLQEVSICSKNIGVMYSPKFCSALPQ